MRVEYRHKSALAFALLLCGTGAWISGQLVEAHAAIWSAAAANAGGQGWLCDATRRLGLDCGDVAHSPWSEIRLPIPGAARVVVMPVAFVGLAYFVFLGAWLMFVGLPRSAGEMWERTPRMVAVLGAAASILLLGLMLTGRAPTCAWCLAVHAVNLALVAIIWRRREVVNRGEVSDAIPAQLHARHVMIFSLIIICGLWLFRREQIAMGSRIQALTPYRSMVDRLRDDPRFLLDNYYSHEVVPIPARDTQQTGSDRPRLIVFTDFTCSACSCNAVRIRDEIVPAFAGWLDVEIRYLPAGGACEDDSPSAACLAAFAAEAARRQGGDAAFQLMHDQLFSADEALSEARIVELARSIGLDAELFRRNLHAPEIRNAIAEGVALARRLAVSGTPTMFLDGRLVDAFVGTITCSGRPWPKTGSPRTAMLPRRTVRGRSSR